MEPEVGLFIFGVVMFLVRIALFRAGGRAGEKAVKRWAEKKYDAQDKEMDDIVNRMFNRSENEK